MKRIALILVLVAVVTAGGLFAGVAMAGGGGPRISLGPNSGPAGTQVTINGWGWTQGPVQLYVDSIDATHLLATPTASGMGSFKACFKMTATTVGPHNILASQSPTQASATFTLTVTEPIDERTTGQLSGIADEVNNIEGKLDNPDYGLNAIATAEGGLKNSINAVSGQLNDISNDLYTLSVNLSYLQDAVLMRPVMGNKTITGAEGDIAHDSSLWPMHVSLTISYSGLDDGDLFYIETDLGHVYTLHGQPAPEPNYGIVTVEFDAKYYWTITADDVNGTGLTINFIGNETRGNETSPADVTSP